MGVRSDYLCLGRSFMNDSMQSKLKCFYLKTTSKPYLRLTRIRVEELYKRPQIVLIHNFLSETEIETMKNMTTPRMRKMRVIDMEGNEKYDDERLATGDFIFEKNSTKVKVMAKRISEITGKKS